MKFHPDILSAHAQFGGDLKDMQRRYDETAQTIARLTAERDDYRDEWQAELDGRIEALRRARAAEARLSRAMEHLSHVIDHYDRGVCLHESVHRGGAIWTICDECGREWADDKGGFQPHVEPPDFRAAREFLEGGK